MRQTLFFPKLTFTAAALLGCSLVSAQSLIIDSTTTTLNTVQGQSSVIIDPVSGNVTVRSASGNACAATPAPVVSVTGPSSGSSQQQVTISWNATNTTGANPCTPSSSPANATWNLGASAASGSRSVTLGTVAQGQTQNQSFTMTCTGNGSGANTLTISVQGPGSTPGCEGTPEAGLVNQGNPGQWTDVFPGSIFPNPIGQNGEVSINTGQFLALSFNSGTAISTLRKIVTAESPGQSGGPLRMSISRCAGDFRASTLNVNQTCLSLGRNNQQEVAFVVASSSPGASICTLAPNTSYFVNMTFKVPANSSVSPPVTASDCSDFACWSLLVPRNLTSQEISSLGLIPPEE